MDWREILVVIDITAFPVLFIHYNLFTRQPTTLPVLYQSIILSMYVLVSL